MADATFVNGSCLCGAVRFRIELPTLFCAHCHCSMCRRNHGAGYVTWFGVAPTQLSFECGEHELTRYRSSEHGTRSFCRRCGSSLLCENSQYPDRIDIVLANMEGAIDREPEMHVYYDDRTAWVKLGDTLPRLGGKSGLEPVSS